jgi:hypothetical protein
MMSARPCFSSPFAATNLWMRLNKKATLRGALSTVAAALRVSGDPLSKE